MITALVQINECTQFLMNQGLSGSVVATIVGHLDDEGLAALHGEIVHHKRVSNGLYAADSTATELILSDDDFDFEPIANPISLYPFVETKTGGISGEGAY